MKRALLPVLFLSLGLASPLALAQGSSKKKATPAPATAPATPAPKKDDGLDVSRLPFTPDSIRQVMAHHMPRIQECYEDHMVEKDKKVEGKLLTTFTITAEGTVRSAKVDKYGSTLKDAGLNDCVVAVLSSMDFPKPPDGRDHPIEYPFNLKAID
ncbi:MULTISPECIES: AgmX/PglI C-terminal domain-containing protein [unclassified Corallococcus]|uniref:AgmX/PglI C-terminal domain-containing protein n=1 Tax=unclassified Corallococcus TaxID=2685029 RepID=UPI001A8F99F2|nr:MULTISPECIES: AgmX/PglI C-terminal domain-containing protein [unclassified Corallococcus]MBN9685334.1 AgmX/PglI C-terminal domain-containing protein [Corallococcus sp. NCSPR001]WAS83214.1 AgmX/PglI C-terminal domain-containing protein [Corallococcus sp. NCRR]